MLFVVFVRCLIEVINTFLALVAIIVYSCCLWCSSFVYVCCLWSVYCSRAKKKHKYDINTFLVCAVLLVVYVYVFLGS